MTVGQAFVNEDWSERDLAGERFDDCRFLRCTFSRADLREAMFKNCGFADAEGQQGANFAFARLDEAVFENCNLAHARFEGADLYAARFADCRLLGARFARARFHRAFGRKVVRTLVSFVDCNLELADLSGAGLSTCELRDCRLRETDLSGADLTGANLTGSDLFQAIIDGAKAAGADLRGADLSGFDLRRLAEWTDLKINPHQQFALLDALGVDVVAEKV
jgi:fluoroquinolone resistance protein